MTVCTINQLGFWKVNQEWYGSSFQIIRIGIIAITSLTFIFLSHTDRGLVHNGTPNWLPNACGQILPTHTINKSVQF